MKYRELLEYTKSNPGCLASGKQKDIDSEIRYKTWVARQNQAFEAAGRHTSKNESTNNHYVN